MKTTHKIMSLLVAITLLAACREVREEDISDEKVDITFPKASQHLGYNTVTFVWEEMEGADEYVIDIVAPRFTDISAYILHDTTISGTTFTYSFAEKGEYEWRIIGRNSGYDSKEVIRILYIDSLENDTTTTPVDTIAVADTTPPAPPYNLVAVPDTTTANLIWVRSDSDVAADSVFLSTDSLFTGIVLKTKTADPTLQVSSLTSATGYFWRVKSVDTSGNVSVPSITEKFTTY